MICTKKWPGEDFVQGIVVATGKVSTRSRRIPCKRLGERVSVKDDRSTRTVNINMPHGVPVTTAITAGGVATGPSTPASAKSGASKLPTPTKVPSSYSSPRYHRM